MHIEEIRIRNFRSLKDVHLQVDKYGAFIGANGSGKSSVLYALNWFFNGTPLLTEDDVHSCKNDDCSQPGTSVEVSVTFTGLTPKDRERLQQYGRGDRVEIRQTWYPDTGKTKTVGNARQGPGFAAVREDQSLGDRRKSYRDLRADFPDLVELTGGFSKDSMFDALSAWEANPANADKLVEVADADATMMMGWNGANVLRECVRFVLVPAATAMSGEVGKASKGTALTEVVGSIMAAASAQARDAWLVKHADAVSDLSRDIRASVEAATGAQASRINAKLSALIPNASVTLTPTVPDFAPKVDPDITTDVTIAGMTNDVARQGHGVQRAVMISMFQVMVPDEDHAKAGHTALDDEDEAAAAARLAESISALPSLIVAVEEPEIYQHPVRARAFARTLCDLSKTPMMQVLLATHSPYFIQPDQFEALHRFTYLDGESMVATASVSSIMASSGLTEDAVRKAIALHVPTEFSEGFFSDGVVLVEGVTDRVVLEALAARLESDLDRLGTTVLSVGGKKGLPVAYAILRALGIPTYVLADGDHGTAARKHKDAAAQHQAHNQHRSATEEVLAAMPPASSVAHGSMPYSFGDPTMVCGHYAVWKDDIEEELGSWPSFVSELATAGVNLSARNTKNLLAYRNAALKADESDLPVVLKSVIAQIVLTSSGSRATPPDTQEPSSTGLRATS